jgi:hypothetical protein
MAPSTLLRQTFSPLAMVANAASQQAMIRSCRSSGVQEFRSSE